MQTLAITIELACARGAAITLCGLLLIATADPAIAAGCSFASQGEGRVTEIIDARSFRLADGRDTSSLPASSRSPAATARRTRPRPSRQ